METDFSKLQPLKYTPLVSVLVFLISLTQECYCTVLSSCGDSLAVLISGAIGVFFGGAALTWLANPLLISSWFLFKKKPKLSLLFSCLAFLTSLSFLLFKRIIVDEGGSYSEIISYKLGYWLWVSSSGIMIAGNIMIKR